MVDNWMSVKCAPRSEEVGAFGGGRSLVVDNGRERGGSNSRPPDEGDLNVGEIPIKLAALSIRGSLSQDRKPGNCFVKSIIDTIHGGKICES